MDRKAYPTDVSDEEWAFIAPYLTLMREDAPLREYPLREVFNGLRYVVRGGVNRQGASRFGGKAKQQPAIAGQTDERE
jgi:transposase